MKYIVWDSCSDDLICCDSRASAEELVLSIAEEEAFIEYNYGINKLDDADTLEEYTDTLRDWWKKYHCSNECIALFFGGINYYIRAIPNLED